MSLPSDPYRPSRYRVMYAIGGGYASVGPDTNMGSMSDVMGPMSIGDAQAVCAALNGETIYRSAAPVVPEMTADDLGLSSDRPEA